MARPSDAKPKLRKAVVVHGRADVALAARLAAETKVPVTLLTAPGAADYVGPDVLLAMVRHGLADAARADVNAVIDCEDAAGRAMAALRAGWMSVLFSGPPAAAAKLAAIAEQHGAALLTERPEACDLGEVANPDAACRAWLARTTA